LARREKCRAAHPFLFHPPLLDDLEHVAHGIAHLLHEVRGQAGERTPYEAAVVDGAELVDEEVGVPGQVAGGWDADPQWPRALHEVCRERNNQRRRMARVEEWLRLNQQHRPRLAGLRPEARVQVGEPDLAASTSRDRARSPRTRR
jgi:hypothetical protein